MYRAFFSSHLHQVASWRSYVTGRRPLVLGPPSASIRCHAWGLECTCLSMMSHRGGERIRLPDCPQVTESTSLPGWPSLTGHTDTALAPLPCTPARTSKGFVNSLQDTQGPENCPRPLMANVQIFTWNRHPSKPTKPQTH